MMGTRIGPYQIETLLGEGGMGSVYRALDSRLGRSVAIKFLQTGKRLTEERRRRFLLEAKTASALNHPNIVMIYDIGREGDADFIVMEYIEGKTLDRWMRERSFSVAELTRAAGQLADALARAHSAGIVHRDLKPANVMMTSDGLVKVLDFGLAKLAERAASAAGDATATITELMTPKTKEGALVGTPQYMSPEQAEGRAIDRRTDIFCFGLLLYELIAHQRPFQRATQVSSLVAPLREDPEPLGRHRADLPPAFEEIVHRCLRKDPAERFQSMADVRDLLLEGSHAPPSYSHASSSPAQVPQIKPLVAVLPFAAIGAPESDYFGEGLTEEIIVALAKLPGLRVAARNSSFSQALREADVREAAQKLRVDHILQGTVRRGGDRLRVTAQLVMASSGDVLWSERYDGSTADIFQIQDEISSSIVAALELQLVSSVSRSSQSASRRKVGIRAHESYLKGRYYWNRRSWESIRRGIECFDSAIHSQPDYALAFVGLSDSYNLLGYYGERPPRDAFPRAKEAAMRALQIDDRVAEAHASLGYEQTFFEWDWEAAAQSQQRAIQLNPQYPSAHQWMGWVHFAAGDYEAALEKLRTAIDLDPLSPIINVHWGLALTNAGDPDAAIQQFRQTAEMLPEFALNYVGWGWSLLRAGRAAAAIEPLERARELSQGRFGMGFLGVAYALDGQPASASALLESMEAAARTTYVSAAERAMIHGAMGDLDGCFSLLQTAVEDRAPDLVRLWFDPWADSVRADPRFDEISNLAGLR